MQLYLLRHADADTDAPSDDERFLSEKGMMQAQRVARFCDAHRITPNIVFTSPLRRAHQTAAAVSEKLGVELKTVRWLSCGVTASAILTQLKDHSNLPAIMIVGHEPDFSLFVAYMIGAAHGENIRIRKGSLTYLSVLDFKEGGARLEFSIPPKLL